MDVYEIAGNITSNSNLMNTMVENEILDALPTLFASTNIMDYDKSLDLPYDIDKVIPDEVAARLLQYLKNEWHKIRYSDDNSTHFDYSASVIINKNILHLMQDYDILKNPCVIKACYDHSIRRRYDIRNIAALRFLYRLGLLGIRTNRQLDIVSKIDVVLNDCFRDSSCYSKIISIMKSPVRAQCCLYFMLNSTEDYFDSDDKNNTLLICTTTDTDDIKSYLKNLGPKCSGSNDMDHCIYWQNVNYLYENSYYDPISKVLPIKIVIFCDKKRNTVLSNYNNKNRGHTNKHLEVDKLCSSFVCGLVYNNDFHNKIVDLIGKDLVYRNQLLYLKDMLYMLKMIDDKITDYLYTTYGSVSYKGDLDNMFQEMIYYSKYQNDCDCKFQKVLEYAMPDKKDSCLIL